MKKVIPKGVLVVTLALLASGPGSAHHSSAMFDKTRTVTIEGTVKEFQYTNPHAWLLVVTTAADGKETVWGFECEGPSSLIRAGIRKSDFTPGTKVVVTGQPMLDGRPAAAWVSAIRGTDNKLFSPLLGYAVK